MLRMIRQYNDIHEPTGRGQFRLHLGLDSHGCVTFNHRDVAAQRGWKVLKNILNSTFTTSVKDKRGRQ